MDKIDKELLLKISNLHEIPQGAYNIRKNGELLSRNVSENIEITTKNDKSGIDIVIKSGTKNQSVHIPVIITKSGLNDLVYNDFFIQDDCDVTIVAGCGIHNDGTQKSQHDGIHNFHIGKNSKVRYIERHIGIGKGAEKVLNPVTNIEIGSGSTCEMQTIQLGGVSSAVRKTFAKLQENSVLNIDERIKTDGEQCAKTQFLVELNGENSKANVRSKSVAKGKSSQCFESCVVGNSLCFGHVECDAITLDKAVVTSIPKIVANCSDSNLVHEAVIGKIAGEQIVKLMTLGLTEKQAEEKIIEGFLK